MTKRIAIVSNSTWNISNFRLNVIRKLVDQGHKVYVIAPIDEYISYKEEFPSVTHINLRYLDRDSTNPIKDALLLLELYRYFTKLKPDFIIQYTHKPNIYGALAARMSNIPSASFITGLGYGFLRKGWLNWVIKSLYRISNKYNKLVVFENEDDKHLFVEEGLLNKDKAFHVNGCGVDTLYFTPKLEEEAKTKTTFTFIGRLLKDKGVVEFAEAAAQIKARFKSDVEFVILGDFDAENPSTISKDQLLTWINEGVIDYRGFVKDVRPHIANSDCIVLPSYREGLPRIVIEGMAMAKPIITTDTAGCRQTCEDGSNGYLVPVQDANALTEAMTKFMNLSKEEQYQMGIKGRLKCEKEFANEIVAAHIYQLLTPHLGDSKVKTPQTQH